MLKLLKRNDRELKSKQLKTSVNAVFPLGSQFLEGKKNCNKKLNSVTLKKLVLLYASFEVLIPKLFFLVSLFSLKIKHIKSSWNNKIYMKFVFMEWKTVKGANFGLDQPQFSLLHVNVRKSFCPSMQKALVIFKNVHTIWALKK